MSASVKAVIDIGTNSVKLLIARVGPDGVEPILETSQQTRLGRGFFQDHVLQPEAVATTAGVVAGFVEQARAFHPTAIKVLATSAAREARNPETLLVAIEAASGIPVEIISGRREAELVFLGASRATGLTDEGLLLLDVGGGSTEFILGIGGAPVFQQSFPIGTVRLLESAPRADPPTPEHLAEARAFLNNYIRVEVVPSILPFLEKAGSGLRLVGTGGTSTLLARMENQMTDYNRARIEGTVFTLARVAEWTARLWGLSVADRCGIIGLPQEKADVIPMGVLIHEAVMRSLALDELRVSLSGLRQGALLADGGA